MAKVITSKEAAAMITEGSRVMIGGFLAAGAPETIIDALVEQNTKNLHTVIIAADYDNPPKGLGKLIINKQVKSAQISHIGTDREIQRQFNEGEINLELVPQGTLMERVRAAGAGLGGVLTQTGLGTEVQDGKDIISIDGKDYILEKPIHAEFGLIKAHKADKFGNLVYYKTCRNSNPIMAMAAKTTIVEVDEIVDELDPEVIVTPGVLVKYIVKKGE